MAIDKRAWINKLGYTHTVEQFTTTKKEQTTNTYINMNKPKKKF